MKTVWVGVQRGQEVGVAFENHKLAQIWAATGPLGREIYKIKKIETEEEARNAD